MSKITLKLAVVAAGHLEYTKPGNPVNFELRRYYGFEGPVGEVKVDEYKNVSMIFEIFEVERDIGAWASLTNADFMGLAFKEAEVKIRADFQKALTENQALLQNFLALPNAAEQKDDDLSF